MKSTKKSSWVKSAFHTIESQELSCSSPSKRARIVNLILKKDQEKNIDSSKAPKVLRNSRPKGSLADNWLDIFTPKNITELAVHPKKVEEIIQWLKQCESERKKQLPNICILSGPTGSGKTTAIRLIAETNNYDIQEWVNPIDMETYDIFDGNNGTNDFYTSRVDTFRSFLFRSSRYKSLLNNVQKRLLLVEDLPNAFINDPTALVPVLDEFMSYGKWPLVFVLADTKSKRLNICYSLFPDDVKVKLNIKHITFNPVAPTLMAKAIKRFCSIIIEQQEQCDNIYKVPLASMVNSVALGAQGDIRNALTNLHFLSLEEAPHLAANALKGISKKPMNKKKDVFKSFGRDESITILHNLGRIFNPKYDKRSQLTHSPENLVDQLSTEPKKMINFIHANYCMHFSSIEDIVKAAEGLSRADVLSNNYRDESSGILALNVAIRSVMIANSKPASGWKPVRGPRRLIL